MFSTVNDLFTDLVGDGGSGGAGPIGEHQFESLLRRLLENQLPIRSKRRSGKKDRKVHLWSGQGGQVDGDDFARRRVERRRAERLFSGGGCGDVVDGGEEARERLDLVAHLHPGRLGPDGGAAVSRIRDGEEEQHGRDREPSPGNRKYRREYHIPAAKLSNHFSFVAVFFFWRRLIFFGFFRFSHNLSLLRMNQTKSLNELGETPLRERERERERERCYEGDRLLGQFETT